MTLKKSSPMVSIIILNYNGINYLCSCLDSIFNTKYDNYEIIFVDNNSSDNSVKFTKDNYGQKNNFKIIKLNKNLGVARGYNIGAKHSKGKYLIFANMDIEVEKNWINEIIKIFEKDVTIGAAQPKILFAWNKNRINSMGHYLTLDGTWFDYIKYGQLNNKKYQVSEIFVALGAAIVVKNDLFKKIGQFDKDFFLYSEELDLCWRIWLSGYRIVVAPSSIIYHHEGAVAGSVKTLSPLRTYHSTKNRLITILKNYSNESLIKYFPIVLLSTFYHVIINSFQNPKLIKYYVIAIIDFIKQFKETWNKHIKIQYLIRRVPDNLLFNKGLIRKRKI